MKITASNSLRRGGISISHKSNNMDTAETKIMKSSVVLKSSIDRSSLLEDIDQGICNLDLMCQQMEEFIEHFEDQIADDLYENMLIRANDTMELLYQTQIIVETVSKQVLRKEYVQYLRTRIASADEICKSMKEALDNGIARYT